MFTQLEIEIMTAKNMQNMKVRIRAFWGLFTRQGGVILPCMYRLLFEVTSSKTENCSIENRSSVKNLILQSML